MGMAGGGVHARADLPGGLGVRRGASMGCRPVRGQALSNRDGWERDAHRWRVVGGPWKHLLRGRGRDQRQMVPNGEQVQRYEGRGWFLNETAYGPYKDPNGSGGR